MLIPCRIQVSMTVKDVKELHAIYIHRDIDGIIQYIGVTLLNELLNFSDARCNSMWLDVFKNHDTLIDLEVIGLTSDEREAYVEQRRLVTAHEPPCNLHGYWVDPGRQAVMCNETGEIFPTAFAASKAHSIAQSAMSNHLNGKIGHKTIKGRTYSRINKRSW